MLPQERYEPIDKSYLTTPLTSSSQAFGCRCRQVQANPRSTSIHLDADRPTIDIKALTSSEPDLVKELGPAFQKYNEEQFTTVKLPGSSEPVLVSSHNSLGGGRYYDIESSSSFDFDHATQKASGAQSYSLESKHTDLVYVVLRERWEGKPVLYTNGLPRTESRR